jgi:uncharacterized membrane protein YedE/YeeE
MDLLPQPWPWYVAGPIIGLCVPLLLVLGNRRFGISSNLRHICAAIAPAALDQFRYDWRRDAWNLWFLAGTVAGGFIAWQVLGIPDIALSAATRDALTALGVQQFAGLAPADVFSWPGLTTVTGFVSVVVGGFLVGFGTAYAGGCTSGHAIFGLATFQLPSLVAVLGFFAGGLAATHWLLPLLF